MQYIFNREKLEQLILDFYVSTGIAVTLYDAAETIIATAPVFTGFCKCLRSEEARERNCDRSNQIHMEEAARRKTTLSYTCHAGLMETITPIFYENTVIAYLQIGQFRDEAAVFSSPEKIHATAVRYGLPEELLLELYGQLPVISDRKLQALTSITNILIRSFWEDGLIRRNRSMLSVKIEQYIEANLTERLSVPELCDRFSVSKFALYRLFREEFQTTVTEFILEKRIALAQQLLRGKNPQSVTQVAAACGFPDYNYFIRVFKDRTGQTPLQYRKNIT